MPVTIHDDRDRAVPLLKAGDLPDRLQSDLTFIIHIAQAPTLHLWGIYCTVGLGVNFVLLLAFGGRARTDPSYHGLPVLVGITSALILATIFSAARTRRRRGEARDRCVRRSICASCGYELAGLSLEADGCAVCPECGAAWRPRD